MPSKRKPRQGAGRVPAALRSPSVPLEGVTPDSTPVPNPLLIGIREGDFPPAQMLLICVAFRQAAHAWRMPAPGEEWQRAAGNAPIRFDLESLANATGFPLTRLEAALEHLQESMVFSLNLSDGALRIHPRPELWIHPTTGEKRLPRYAREAIRRINDAYTTPSLRVCAPGVSS